MRNDAIGTLPPDCALFDTVWELAVSSLNQSPESSVPTSLTETSPTKIQLVVSRGIGVLNLRKHSYLGTKRRVCLDLLPEIRMLQKLLPADKKQSRGPGGNRVIQKGCSGTSLLNVFAPRETCVYLTLLAWCTLCFVVQLRLWIWTPEGRAL